MATHEQPQFDEITRYKYRLCLDYAYELPLVAPRPTDPSGLLMNFLTLEPGGVALMFHNGYCWDGSSGPTIDSKTCHRGSLIHDGAYQMLRAGAYGQDDELDAARGFFDELYRQICLEDGMGPIQAATRYQALRLFGGSSARPGGGLRSKTRARLQRRGKVRRKR